MQLRPASLARYIAASACRRSSSGDGESAAIEHATPMLAETNTSPWRNARGSRKHSRSRSAVFMASISLTLSGSRTTNSSPLIRPTMAVAGTALVSRWATATKTSSPALWPSESLIFLNRSTSMKWTAGTLPVLHALSTASSMCFNMRERLGRRVSASVCAVLTSIACVRALVLTACITRAVTDAASTNKDIARITRSTWLRGSKSAMVMSGTTSAVVVSTSRPSNG